MAYVELKSFWRDDSGAAMLEFTAAAFTFFIVLFGILEFSLAYFQWNSATKAVQFGARVAAVSNPVDSDLVDWDMLDLDDACYESGGPIPGDKILKDAACVFDRVCTSDSADGSTGTCTNGTYDPAAMRDIVFGRGKTSCQEPTSLRDLGMCSLFSRITPENVVVRYQYTGLGYAGRPGGPVPTVTVSLTNLNYDFILVGGLAGLNSIAMPSFATTVTGEDLAKTWSG